MTVSPRTYTLGRMSWPEVAAALETVELVLIPIGSTEQHGPNLGLGQDHLITQAFCERAAERLSPRLLALPAIPWGISDHHMNFAGSMTLRPETFLDLLEDVVLSMLHHGFRRFMIVNGHGGNQALMSAAVQDLGFRLDIDFIGSTNHYTLGRDELRQAIEGPTTTGHACEIETSHAYYLAPDLVREAALAPADIDEVFTDFVNPLRDLELDWPTAMNAKTRNGALGDARLASHDAGSRIIESAIDDFEELLNVLHTAPRWDGPPHRNVRKTNP